MRRTFNSAANARQRRRCKKFDAVSRWRAWCDVEGPAWARAPRRSGPPIIYAPPRASKRSISVVTLGGLTQREVDHFVMAITSDAAVIRHTAPHLAQMAHGESRSVFPISVNGITRWTDRDGRFHLCGTGDDRSRVGLNTDCLSKGIKCPSFRFSSFSLVFCSFPVRRLPLRRIRSQHYALGPDFKRLGRLKRK